MNESVKQLFESQLVNWPLARTNFEGLKTVKEKTFSFEGFDVKVQFNPARIASSAAKVDAQSIAARKCFLCAANRPPEQEDVSYQQYSILVNPFPIFPEHFTIVHQRHIPQQIKPFFSDLLQLAKEMSDYVLFYNGPECGASAPDHLHFQAGTKNFLPLMKDYQSMKAKNAICFYKNQSCEAFRLDHYLRTVICIESSDVFAANDFFIGLFADLQGTNLNEPMMNIVCDFRDGKWHTFIFPRDKFRPWQYTADEPDKLLVSPATVEMSGVLITPIESHFDKIGEDDVRSILTQSTLTFEIN
jgi:ATP adenylyltransferase/5',5'''-P-1,P-4-tetraphosphate phosphorylase II